MKNTFLTELAAKHVDFSVLNTSQPIKELAEDIQQQIEYNMIVCGREMSRKGSYLAREMMKAGINLIDFEALAIVARMIG